LDRLPSNANRLSSELDLDYKTVQEHLQILQENGIVGKIKESYGAPFFIMQDWSENEYLKELMRELK